jgi:hypothetical protein
MLDAILTRIIDALALAGATLSRTAPPELVAPLPAQDEPVRIRHHLRLGQPST